MKKEKTKIIDREGRVYILATFNNTLVTITDRNGNTLFWSSSGRSGFKGTRKATPFAAMSAIGQVIQKAQAGGMKEVEVYIKGPGPGRDAALRLLRNVGLKIKLIADVTPIPHNGVRPKKKRRA